MPAWSTLALFFGAALVLLVVPGPSVLYIVTRSVDQGRRAGLVSALGVGVGSLVHLTAAVLGISALLVSSATAFMIVKYAGAVYLFVLGVRTFVARGPIEAGAPRPPLPLRRVFSQGVVVNALNPKTALFFLAFFPQFIDPDRGSVAIQTLLFGGMFTALGIVSDSTYAMVAGTVGGWLRGNARFARRQRAVVGSVFIGLGVTTALAGTEG